MANKYKVLCLETKKAWGDDQLIDGSLDSSVRVYETGDEAQVVADYLCRRSGKKWQVRPHIVDDSWRQREAKRFYDGDYLPPPWDSENWCWGSKVWNDHFAHLSIENDVRIAFTPNEQMGLAHRHTRIKPGPYLTKYYGRVLDSNDIRHWVAQFSILHEDIELKIARTADEIENVYKKGPTSCMDGQHNFSRLPENPVRMYAGPDLAVAYLEPNKATRTCEHCEERDRCNGDCGLSPKHTITARSVIWPDRKLHSRVYGDADRLILAMQREGYKIAKGLQGARLKRVPYKNAVHPENGNKVDAFVTPYIDGEARYVVDNGEYLVIAGEENDLAVNKMVTTQHGYAYDNRVRCGICNEPKERLRHYLLSEDGNRNLLYCQTCRERESRAGNLVVCQHTGRTCLRKDAISLGYLDIIGNPKTVTCHKRYIESYFAVCFYTHQWLWIGDGYSERHDWVQLSNGEYASRRYWQEHLGGKLCGHCGQAIPTGTDWHCNQYSACYGQPVWTIFKRSNGQPYVNHIKGMGGRPEGSPEPMMWEEAQAQVEKLMPVWLAEQEALKIEAAKRRRSAAQRARREREREAANQDPTLGTILRAALEHEEASR